ncbi:DUF4890 domain-containing protein [Prevotella sp. OH937_COT-195]|uniref:DUF4890 domain-containing protein n=1 Tax=Prevotella sp. OH937_COT-195 TaxID=2491051 RepID=UPI000F648892|nr:DUF4890 domain-containing protein [Prevotella sp. OH937_COT-195]RRD02019.1 DUF4890 domain-containing protein [Prevotella sp. OH937_COT-195]
MKRVFVIMVAAMAMSCAMAQNTKTCSKEKSQAKCEQRKQCEKQEKATAKCTTSNSGKCEKKAEAMSSDKCQKQGKHCTDYTEMMVKKFNLTPEQAAKVKALNDMYPELARACVGKHHEKKHETAFKTDKDCKKACDKKCEKTGMSSKNGKQTAAVKECGLKREAYDAEMKKILTNEQFAIYEKCKQQKKCKHKK